MNAENQRINGQQPVDDTRQTQQYIQFIFQEEHSQFNHQFICADYSIIELYQIIYQHLQQNINQIFNFWIYISNTPLNPNENKKLSQLGYYTNQQLFVVFYQLKINLYIDKILKEQFNQIISVFSTFYELKAFIEALDARNTQLRNTQVMRGTQQKKPPYLDLDNIQIYFGNNSDRILNLNVDNYNNRIYLYSEMNQELTIKINSFQGLSQKFRESTLILDNFILQINEQQNMVYYKTLKPFELSGYVKKSDAKFSYQLGKKFDWNQLHRIQWDGQKDIKYAEIPQQNGIDKGFMIEWDDQNGMNDEPTYSVITFQAFGI